MKRVSAIMPTRGRRALAHEAMSCFLAQTYPHKELVILDDLDDRSFTEGLAGFAWTDVPILYALSRSRSIPEKRNAACAISRGDIVMHFDSDDWSHPGRMADQLRLLEDSGLAVAGYHTMLFSHENGNVYKYIGAPDYAIGASLTYTKTWWAGHKFHEEKYIGEDNVMVREAVRARQLISVDAGQWMVARIHADSTSRDSLNLADYGGALNSFQPVSRDALPEMFHA